MSLAFFEHLILNSPYACPGRHWDLDAGFDTLVKSFVATQP
jgi:hypothetical protein